MVTAWQATAVSPQVQVDAWRVHDTGLVAAPGRFRRLPGRVRHHEGQGDAWPPRVVLTLTDHTLRVATPAGELIGTWPDTEVGVQLVGQGPPVSFVVQLPEAAHLLSAAADAATSALLAALT